MNLKQKTVKGILWSFIEKWCNQIVSTSVFLILARLLGPEAYGLTALAGVFLAFMSPFLNQGFAEAIIQREEIEPEHLDTAFWISVITGSLLIFITIASASLVANFFNEPKLTLIIRWLSLNFLFVAFQSVPAAILRRQLLFRVLAIRSSVATIVSGAVGLFMAFQGFGVWSLVGQQLTNGLVGVITLWKASEWRPGWRISSKHFKELFSFSSSVMGIFILRFFNRRSDDFLIGYFLGSTALGYYAVAYRLLLVMVNLLTTTTTQVTLPAFSKLQKEVKKLRQVFYTTTKLTSYITFPAFIGVMILAPELVVVLFGEQWEPSIPVMQVLSIVGIIHSLSYSNETIMMAMGKPNWRLKINLLNVISNMTSFLIAVRWGILGVAIAFTISGYLLYPLNFLLTKRLINIKAITYLRQYLAPLIASLSMAIVLSGTKEIGSNLLTTNVLLVICIFLGMLVYLVVIHLIEPKFTKEIFKFAKLALSKKLPIK